MVKKLLFVPVVALGVVAAYFLIQGRKEPTLRKPGEEAKGARVLTVPVLSIRPRVIGYGVARPGRVWQAIPQVSGRIKKLSPKIREGNFVSNDALLVTIDPDDYNLDVAASRARLAALQAQLAELTARKSTLDATLQIEQQSLKLAEATVTRIRNLVRKKALPAADLDREQRTALSQRQRVQEMQNTLTLLPSQKAVLDAQVKQEAAKLKRSVLAVERTKIRAPFALRVGQVNVEEGQVVQAGQVLFHADGIDSTEVTAWLPLRAVRGVISKGDADVTRLDPKKLVENPIADFGLTSTVRLPTSNEDISWTATVVRIRGIDAKTRTLGMDVSVAKPYENIVPGTKPPLTRGMYVEVHVTATARPGRVVIPRSALHGDTVYVMDAAKRLRRRTVVPDLFQSRFVSIRSGLKGGESLVLSEPAPAIDGLLLEPHTDSKALEDLEAAAAGTSDAR